MSKDAIVRKQVSIFGRVQGCGFRRRICKAAELIGVAGWVWNNQDGSVTAEMQGTEEQIKKTLELVENSSDLIKIRKINAVEIPVESGDSGFGICYTIR